MKSAKTLITSLLLMFLSVAVVFALPKGSYVKSCTKISVKNNTLSAICKNSAGIPVPAQYTNVSDCKNLENANGILTCVLTPEVNPQSKQTTERFQKADKICPRQCKSQGKEWNGAFSSSWLGSGIECQCN